MFNIAKVAAMLFCISSMALSPILLCSQEKTAASTPVSCKEVHARYAIYVERDSLWIPGSKHFIIVTDDKLDDILQKVGWQDHVLFGDFTLCSASLIDPKKLNNHSDVTIKSYHNIQIHNR